MANKLPLRYRAVLFALVMSCFTSMIVSATIIGFRTGSYVQFFKVWPSSVAIAWPIVFVAILVIAPLVNKFLDLFVERP